MNTFPTALAAGLVLAACSSTQNATVDATEAPAPEAIDATEVTVAVPSDSYSIDIAFGTHLDMEMPEQDVYIERESGSNEVWRVTVGDNDMSAQLYKTCRHDAPQPVRPERGRAAPQG